MTTLFIDQMKVDCALRRAGGSWEMPSSGQTKGGRGGEMSAAGQMESWGGGEMSALGQTAGWGRLGNAINGELAEMLAGIWSNVLGGVEPRRLHHLCIVTFELLYQ